MDVYTFYVHLLCASQGIGHVFALLVSKGCECTM